MARIDACDTCHTYVNTIDHTRDGSACAIADDVASISLDLWAREQGYHRARPNYRVCDVEMGTAEMGTGPVFQHFVDLGTGPVFQQDIDSGMAHIEQRPGTLFNKMLKYGACPQINIP